jgi:phenylpropionate dioxygenase-like ring-hydroxylating dioxygenase large terminal subunit
MSDYKYTRTLTETSSYFDETAFERENQQLFQQSWICVGSTLEVTKDNDFITATVGGVSIFAQNFQGKIRVFKNICSHRFAQIKSSERGSGPVKCLHGWIYDENGVPVEILGDEQICEKPENREAPKLQEYAVGICGKLIFVNLSAKPMSLEKYLGSYFKTFSEISESWERRVGTVKVNIAANWKFCTENSLDDYHPMMVHPQSYGKNGLTPDGVFQYYYEGSHSHAFTPMAAPPPETEPYEHALANRTYRVQGYVHYLCYPNMTIATTMGHLFSLVTFRPIDATHTELNAQMFLVKKGPQDPGLKQRAISQVLAFVNGLCEEDKRICELVQLGSIETAAKGYLSKQELRVAAFQNAYREQVG